MYNNIGGKVKILAKVLCWAGIAGSVIAGLIMIIGGGSAESILTGILTMIGGALSSWLGSWVTYAVGEAAETSQSNAVRLREIAKKLDPEGTLADMSYSDPQILTENAAPVIFLLCGLAGILLPIVCNIVTGQMQLLAWVILVAGIVLTLLSICGFITHKDDEKKQIKALA